MNYKFKKGATDIIAIVVSIVIVGIVAVISFSYMNSKLAESAKNGLDSIFSNLDNVDMTLNNVITPGEITVPDYVTNPPDYIADAFMGVSAIDDYFFNRFPEKTKQGYSLDSSGLNYAPAIIEELNKLGIQGINGFRIYAKSTTGLKENLTKFNLYYTPIELTAIPEGYYVKTTFYNLLTKETIEGYMQTTYSDMNKGAILSGITFKEELEKDDKLFFL